MAGAPCRRRVGQWGVTPLGMTPAYSSAAGRGVTGSVEVELPVT